MQDLGYNIKILRLKKGIDQQGLAQIVGCSQAHISGIEHGKDLSISLLLKISKALDCKITDIVR